MYSWTEEAAAAAAQVSIHTYCGYFVYGRFKHKLSSYENAKNRMKPVNENKTSNSGRASVKSVWRQTITAMAAEIVH